MPVAKNRKLVPPKSKSRYVVKDKSNPLMIVLGADSDKINNYYTKQPHSTAYAENTMNVMNEIQGRTGLKGAADYYDYLDKVDPVTEEQLKAIFPRATPTMMTDPLKQVDKVILHDNIRREGNTRRALFFLAHFILGKETQPTLDVNRKFATEERKQIEIDAIKNNETYLNILEDLMNRDDEVDLHSRLVELLISGHGYGRSILVKQYDSQGFPCRLIPFSSTRLGRVWTDKKTHEFLGVEYLDYPSNKRILLAKDIIHYEADDYLISPNSRYYGMPSGEPSMYIAMANRQANEIAKPEIMARMYAPIMLVKVSSRSEEKLIEIESKWKAGKTIFFNDEIEVDVIAIPHDLEKLTKTVDENSKQIYRDHTVPLVVAFQDEQNRATAESSMIQWYEGPLQFKRTHFSNVIWRQWYKPQLEIIFENMEADRVAAEGGLYNYMVNKALGNDGEGHQKIQLPFKITLEYENIRTTGYLDTLAGTAQFYDRGLINDDIAREEANLGKYNEKMHEYNDSKMMTANKISIALGQNQNQGNNMFSQEQQNQQQTQISTDGSIDTPKPSNLGTAGFRKGLPTRSTGG